jgi:hypothetical protein
MRPTKEKIEFYIKMLLKVHDTIDIWCCSDKDSTALDAKIVVKINALAMGD